MEDIKISEQESLELINRMIQQTKKDSSIGSGDTFLIWGYLVVVCTLIVVALASFAGGANWGWIFFAIPVLGFSITEIKARKKKKDNCAVPYSTKSINSIWAGISGVFAAYITLCLLNWSAPAGWTGMLFLCLLLPGMGTYNMGVILKEKVLQVCGMIGIIFGLSYLHHICCGDTEVSVESLIAMAITILITQVIPGHYLNYKSKK